MEKAENDSWVIFYMWVVAILSARLVEELLNNQENKVVV